MTPRELLGVEVIEAGGGTASGRLAIVPELLAPNGYLHAGAVVTLADITSGFGCRGSLPEGRTNFATIELKTNFLATALSGELRCEAQLVHGGRTTQVWDAVVTDEDGKKIAVFRCTQLLL